MTRQLLIGGYVSLIACLVGPLFVKVPVAAQMMSISTLIIVIASINAAQRERARQLLGPDKADPRDVIGRDQAYKFPLVASTALLGMFLAFKYLPKDWVSFLLTIYGVVFGGLAFAGVLSSLIEQLPSIPPILKKEVGIKEYVLVTACDGLGLVLAAPFTVWYYKTRAGLPNNILACGLALSGIDLLAISEFKASAILLCGLFVYDIFWVFGSKPVFGSNVMVSVAKQFEGPIKLVFPQFPGAGPENTSMLGLGDIVVPGLFIALMLRFDLRKLALDKQLNLTFKTVPYFVGAIGSYFAGLVATYIALTVFKAAQPALLYLVPSCLLAAIGMAAFKGELRQLIDYTEEEEDDKKKKNEKDGEESSTTMTTEQSEMMKEGEGDGENDRTNVKSMNGDTKGSIGKMDTKMGNVVETAIGEDESKKEQ